MKPRPINIILLLIWGVAVNFIATIAIVQYTSDPPAYGQDYATHRIFREPAPTPPIFPAFEIRGPCVSITGDNPPLTDSSPNSESDDERYIVVTVSVGWPFRTLQTQSQYTGAGWAKPTASLHWPGRANTTAGRDLPLGVIWTGMLMNSLLILVAGAAPRVIAGSIRRRVRMRRSQCPACAYPVGTSPVCTECGVALR